MHRKIIRREMVKQSSVNVNRRHVSFVLYGTEEDSRKARIQMAAGNGLLLTEN
jgi:hypothetical protein